MSDELNEDVVDAEAVATGEEVKKKSSWFLRLLAFLVVLFALAALIFPRLGIGSLDDLMNARFDLGSFGSSSDGDDADTAGADNASADNAGADSAGEATSDEEATNEEATAAAGSESAEGEGAGAVAALGEAAEEVADEAVEAVEAGADKVEEVAEGVIAAATGADGAEGEEAQAADAGETGAETTAEATAEAGTDAAAEASEEVSDEATAEAGGEAGEAATEEAATEAAGEEAGDTAAAADDAAGDTTGDAAGATDNASADNAANTQALEEENAALNAQIEALEAELANERELSSSSVKSAEIAKQSEALSALKIVALGGGDIVESVRDLEATGVAIPDTLKGEISSVPTEIELQNEFGEYAIDALRASAIAQAGDGMFDGIIARFKAEYARRSLTPMEGMTPDAVLSRAEDELRKGDLEASLSEVSLLPSEAQEAMAPWVAGANQRLDVLTAISQLATQLTTE